VGRDLKPVAKPGARTLRSGDLGQRTKLPGTYGSGAGNSWRKRYEGIYERETPAVRAQNAPFPASVHPNVVQMLTLNGKRTPYIHQAEAASKFLDEHLNVALVTHTASGKTISFLAPVLTTLAIDPAATAVMVYPMNALATDQLKNLVDLGFEPVPGKNGVFQAEIGGVTVMAGVMNGDTAEGVRRTIREEARLIITNHAALHASILQQATRTYSDGSSWRRILMNLQVLVLDEAHSYNGVEGTNAALAFRRLLALSEVLSGCVPRVILATATIGNPLEHAEALTGITGGWAIVDHSGAQQFPRSYSVILPAEHPKGDGRWAASVVAMEVALEQAIFRKKILIFCPSRSGTERMADKINEKLGRKVAIAFNAAIPAAQKREFLANILEGKVQIVCTTSALELGVDIGAMDVVIVLGHPGDHASFNQRSGRIGRTSPGEVFLVLDENQHPINTYLEANPDAIFWDPESRVVYPSNKIVGLKHAACSYLETQDLEQVRRWFPAIDPQAVVETAQTFPYPSIAMVGLGNFGQFKALDPNGRPIQELGGQDAILHWYRGAVLRNAVGEFFRVIKLDTDRLTAETESAGLMAGTRIYTSPEIQGTQTPIEGTQESLDPEAIPVLGVIRATVADYDVVQQTVGWKEYEYRANGSDPEGMFFALAPQDMNPAIGLYTRGVAIDIAPQHPLHSLLQVEVGAVKALEDALSLTVTLIVQARPGDVRVRVRPDVHGLHILAWDMAEGGMGWSEVIVHRLHQWLEAGGKALKNCRCGMKGCPRCSMAGIHGHKRELLANTMIETGRSRKKS